MSLHPLDWSIMPLYAAVVATIGLWLVKRPNGSVARISPVPFARVQALLAASL